MREADGAAGGHQGAQRSLCPLLSRPSSHSAAADRRPPSAGRTLAQVIEKKKYCFTDQSLGREIEVLARVSHPNCIEMIECYITSKRVYIVTEIFTGGELLHQVLTKGSLGEQVSAYILQQILEGISYLHDNGIVHRDLKLENIMLMDAADFPRVRIADFGLSKSFSGGDVLQTLCGSPQYVAPEILHVGAGNIQQYSPAVDIWSAGVICYMLLSGLSPFSEEQEPVLFQKIKAGDYNFKAEIWQHCSQEAKVFVTKLMNVDPSLRYSAKQALQDPWLVGTLRSLQVQ